MLDAVLKDMRSHLGFLGYTVEEKEGGRMLCEHKVKLNMSVKKFRGMVLFTSIFGSTDVAKSDRSGFLNYINELNSEATVCRYYVDKDFDMMIEAMFPQVYEREAFSNFVDAWDSDTLPRIVGNDNSQKFLA